MKQFASFGEFYPFYLAEHANRTCRRLHVVGSTLVIACIVALAITRNLWWLAAALVCGYGFAWIGHFRFEHNRPATFRYPFYSLASDFRMWWELNLGKLKFREQP